MAILSPNTLKQQTS